MTETIVQSILFGFGIYSITIMLSKPLFSGSTKIKIEKFDNSACTLIPAVGLIYLLNRLGTLFFQYGNLEDITEIYQISNRLFGPYWLGYWISPLLSLSSQLLWFKKLHRIILIRIIIAITLMVSIERIVVFLTSLHRDYLPGSWMVLSSSKKYEWLYSVGVFGLVSILFHLIKTRLNKNNV